MISIFAVFCAISVIINKNPIISVLFLIGLFASISCYLIMLGLSFIGLSYLIVYIGAVSILFLFILMLINIRISELQSDTNNSIPLTIIIGISLSYSLFHLLPYDIAILSNFNSNLNKDLMGFSFNGASSEDYNSNFMEQSLNTNKYKDLFFTTSKI
jgi:NADH-ubiquinone oxidoreductase chain 6